MPSTIWETSNNRVLLVDDDELYLETMMAELEDRGFATRGYLDGPSLFKELDRASEADALLLDWTLPSMSGIDVLSVMRERGIDVPVAFLTGRALVFAVNSFSVFTGSVGCTTRMWGVVASCVMVAKSRARS